MFSYRSIFSTCTLLAGVVVVAGCGQGTQPVRGTVTLSDGKPLTQGMLVFRRVAGGDPMTARAIIQPDGSYEVGAFKKDGGTPTGRYQVAINTMNTSETPDEDLPLPYHRKYLTFETSGLELDVEHGVNEIPFKLDAPEKKSK